MDIQILFQDSEIIACIKPVGIVSQEDSSGGASMVSILSELTKGEIFPLHRLDKEVGGVMVFAKTKAAAAILSRDIAEHRFLKQYIALVHGKPQEKSGEMADLLFKDSKKNKSFVVKKERKGVKKAILNYEVLNEKGGLTAVLVTLKTGRTHQIRVQFASRKMSLAGDKKYGAKDDFSTIGLWSYRISFTHPKTKEKLTFENQPKNFIKNYM